MSHKPHDRVSDAPLRLRIADVTARLSGLSAHSRADMLALLRPFVLPESDPPADEPVAVEIMLRQSADARVWEVWMGDEQVFATGVYERLLRRLEWLVVAQCIERSRRWLVWHAATLERHGRALTLIGHSGAGKSTLASELALRGWAPLADDLTLLDLQTRTLAPFARCFHVSAATSVRASALLEWPVAPLTDYARPVRWGVAGATPTWLVVARREVTAPSMLEPISRAQAIGALFAATIRNPARALAASVAAAVAGAALGCWELNNNDLTTTLELLETALRGPASGVLRSTG